MKKVPQGQAPIVLIGSDLSTGPALHIADRYHRVSASYHLNEDTEIPCRLLNLPGIAVRHGVQPESR